MGLASNSGTRPASKSLRKPITVRRSTLYLEAIKSGKTLRGFDIDSETRFEFYRVKGNEYVFQTFMEGYNTDFESRTTILNSDSE